jgi:hypothetical protein
MIEIILNNWYLEIYRSNIIYECSPLLQMRTSVPSLTTIATRIDVTCNSSMGQMDHFPLSKSSINCSKSHGFHLHIIICIIRLPTKSTSFLENHIVFFFYLENHILFMCNNWLLMFKGCCLWALQYLYGSTVGKFSLVPQVRQYAAWIESTLQMKWKKISCLKAIII